MPTRNKFKRLFNYYTFLHFDIFFIYFFLERFFIASSLIYLIGDRWLASLSSISTNSLAQRTRRHGHAPAHTAVKL